MGRPPVLPKHLIFSRQKKEAKIVAMSSSIVILLGLLAAASAMSPHKDCGSKGTITGLDINGNTVNKEVTKYVEEQECSKVAKQKTETREEQECNTVTEKQCKKISRKECNYR